MKTAIIFSFLITIQTSIFCQATLPLVKNNYQKQTSYEELSEYVQILNKQSDLLKAEIIGHSAEGKDLYALLFSNSEFGKNDSKIKVLIFAQQHGNEQSGKEGALLLANELLKPENQHLFERIDLALIPQMNPDGSEKNTRRNAQNMDLNRNHLILTEPETIALHSLFDKYLFEVSMDVHEYSPYGEDWKKYGYRKNSLVTSGGTTNTNVSEKIRGIWEKQYYPYFQKYLAERNYSSFAYCPGGPPEVNYMRLSTYDINDGRQSLGILNTLSFIQEGMNGTDDSIENLRQRSESQMAGMLALLNFVYENSKQIQTSVAAGRAGLVSGSSNQEVSIQLEHVKNGQTLELPLYSYATGNDTIVSVIDFRPVVQSIYDVEKPTGYLIPADSTELIEWAKRQNLQMVPFEKSKKYTIDEYFISKIDSIDFEGDTVINPIVELKPYHKEISAGEYYFIPTAQLKGNMVVIALEPKSILGLATYKNYENLVQAGKPYPILRVNAKNP
jgi:hypothetical protein